MLFILNQSFFFNHRNKTGISLKNVAGCDYHMDELLMHETELSDRQKHTSNNPYTENLSMINVIYCGMIEFLKKPADYTEIAQVCFHICRTI